MTQGPRVAAPNQSAAKAARFSVFELDLSSAQLRRNGSKVPLQELPFRLLVFLLERAGEVVTREELRERLWPAEVVDFDHGLNVAVRKLREALDDSADSPRFIETLARRGYRFIAPVTWVTDSKPRRRLAPLIALASALVVLSAGAITYRMLRREPEWRAGSSGVAVLPFTNEDRDTQHLSDGLTEILIDSLSTVPNLRVMARTTVFEYKGTKLDPRSVGRALKVNSVVAGHIRREGDGYVIHVELVDVGDGAQLWGDQFRATNGTLSAVQSRIFSAVSNQLTHGWHAARIYSNDPEAYELYLKGLYTWNKRGGKDDLQRSADYFRQAIARDPNFAAAHAGLANAYGVMVGYGVMPVREGIEKIMAEAQRTLELDPNNAEALVSIATTKYRNLWDFAGADRDYRRALASNPNYATGHQWYADYLRSMGRWTEARREIEAAYKLDPLSGPINTMVCFNLYYERRYREAIAAARRAAQLDPRLASPHCVAASLMALDQFNEALDMLDAKAEHPMYRPADRQLFFNQAADWLKQHQSKELETPVQVAGMYARAGQSDEAFAWLEKAYQSRVSYLTNVNVDPLFDSLHGDPRFQSLLQRIGLPAVTPPRMN